MHATSKVGVIALLLSLMSFVAEAGTLEGAGIGAGVGATVAGPPGAVVGGVLGVAVGGPNIISGHRHYRRCWRGHSGYVSVISILHCGGYSDHGECFS